LSRSNQGNRGNRQNLITQPGPRIFILVGYSISNMEGAQGGSPLRLPEFYGRGEEDVAPHWFICEAIWRAKSTMDANKLVEFQTLLWGRALQWYMKFVDCPQGGVAPTLAEVNK
jgi:hypothetical protein